MTKRIAALVTLLVVLLLAACGGTSSEAPGGGTETGQPGTDDGAQEDDQGPRPGGELIVANNADAKVLDPHLSSDLYSARVFDQIFDTLVGIDFDGNYVPVLAEDWEVNEDGTVWTFKLRRGVKFHDGQEMTAEDVKFSLERIKNPDTQSPHRPDFADIASIETPDDYTVVVTLNRPSGVFLSALLNGHVVPKHVVEERGAEFNTNPVGTGPYKFVEWIPDDRIVLEAFEDYWAGRPYPDRLVFRPIPDGTTRVVELETGGVHLTAEVPSQDMERLSAAEGITVDHVIGTNYRLLAMNTSREPFDDPLVRQAIAHAVDKQRIIDVVYSGVAVKAEGPLPPSSWAYDAEFKGRDYDPELARELLAKSSHPDGFEVDLLISEDERLQRDAVLIQSMLAELNIKVNIETVEWGTFLDRLMSRDYDMLRVGWTTSPDPDSLLYNVFHSSSEQFNFTAYNNPQVDELLDQGRSETDLERRKEIYRQVQSIVVDEAPMIFLYHERRVVAYADQVRGFKPHPSGALYFKNNFGADVWLDQ